MAHYFPVSERTHIFSGRVFFSKWERARHRVHTPRKVKKQQSAALGPASWEADPGYYYNFSHLGCSPPNIIVNHKNNLVDIAFGLSRCAARPMLLIGREWRSAANFIFIDWWVLRAYNLTEYYYITTVLPNGGAPPTKQSLVETHPRDHLSRRKQGPRSLSAFFTTSDTHWCRLDEFFHSRWIC